MLQVACLEESEAATGTIFKANAYYDALGSQDPSTRESSPNKSSCARSGKVAESSRDQYAEKSKQCNRPSNEIARAPERLASSIPASPPCGIMRSAAEKNLSPLKLSRLQGGTHNGDSCRTFACSTKSKETNYRREVTIKGPYTSLLSPICTLPPLLPIHRMTLTYPIYV